MLLSGSFVNFGSRKYWVCLAMAHLARWIDWPDA